MRRITQLAFVFAISGLVGCGGGSQTLPSGNNALETPIGTESQMETPIQHATAFPDSLPQDALQPWEELGSDGKVAAATSGSTEFMEGPQTHLKSGDAFPWNGALRMASGDVGAGNLSYAIYRIPLGGTEPGVVSVDANLLPMGDGNLGGYYVGLADYGNNSWQWFGPVTDAHWRISSVQAMRDGANFLTGIGNVFVCVVAHDGAAIDVVGVGVDPVDLGDTTVPDAPTGLVLTPVSGGIELAWTAVGGSDVAGYKVYCNDRAFGEHTAQFANTVDGLQGRTFILDATSQKYVAVRAVDKSGNESAISTVERAMPLAGTAPQVAIDVTNYSVMRNEQVSLVASGADTYDWDTDGDGIFDIMGNATGTADVDTSQTGLIRPMVRGVGSESTSVAMSAVSVIVSSNSRPVAEAHAAPTSGDAPLLVYFDALNSTDFDGELVGGGWDFDGDGNTDIWYPSDISNMTGTNHTYTEPGVYNAKLRIADNDGAWDVDTLTVVVYGVDPLNTLPTADLSISPGFGDVGDSFTLDATDSGDTDGTIVNYEWDFDGDGAFDAYGISPSITHHYLVHGVFSTMVRVTDNSGGQATATADVRINEVFDLDHPWPAKGHDVRHTGRSPFYGAQSNAVKWSFTTGDEIWSSPAIAADGTIYVGCEDNKLYAVNHDGSLRWTFVTGGIVRSCPAIGTDGAIYVGSWDNNFYAINPDGTERWSMDFGAGVYSMTIGAAGIIYVGCNNKRLYAITPDGDGIWSFLTDGAISSAPAIGADGTVYIGSSDSKLYAINPDGTEKWSYTCGSNIVDSPAIGTDGTVYIGSLDNKLYAINPDGSLQWTFDLVADIWASASIGQDGTIYIGNDKMYAINPNGTLKGGWPFTTWGWINSDAAIGADGMVYVGTTQGVMYAINQNGSVNWSYETGSEISSSPAIGADGTVFVGNYNNELFAFGSGGNGGNTPPTADLVATPEHGVVPLEIEFDASSSTDSDGFISNFEWDFNGDGLYDSYGPSGRAYHTFAGAGTYVAKVRVTDNFGDQDTATAQLVVLETRQSVDTTNDVGQFTSLAVVNGNPAVSYYDATAFNLMYLRANDAGGSIWGTPVVIDEPGDVGQYTSLAVVNGNPAVSYYDASADDLRYVRATDTTGSAWGAPIAVDSGDDVGQHTSLVIVDGNPAISYYDFTNTNLKYVRANDTSGTSWDTPVTADATGDVGTSTSMAVVENNPAISYFDSSNSRLKFIRAATTSGGSWNTPVDVNTSGMGDDTSLVVLWGGPAIAFNTTSSGHVSFVMATNSTGSAWGSSYSLDTVNAGKYVSLVEMDSKPVVCYYDSSNDDLKLIRATHWSGNAWDPPLLLDTAGSVGKHISMAIVDGSPAISYYDETNLNLKYLKLY